MQCCPPVASCAPLWPRASRVTKHMCCWVVTALIVMARACYSNSSILVVFGPGQGAWPAVSHQAGDEAALRCTAALAWLRG
jgi:hypothetical protein